MSCTGLEYDLDGFVLFPTTTRKLQAGVFSEKQFEIPGGKWDSKQDKMFEYAERKEIRNNFFVSSDKWSRTAEGGEQSVHVFSSFQNAEAFLRFCVERTADRYFYELIKSGSECKAYLDIEYKRVDGDKTPESAEALEQVLAGIHTVLQREYSLFSQEIIVLEGTRKTRKTLSTEVTEKVSFHFVIPSLIFERNHCGKMKAFAENVQLTIKNIFGDDCVDMVDRGVYGRNQKFRTPLSCKLTDITGTVLKKEGEGGEQMTRSFFLQCMVTNVPLDKPDASGVRWVPMNETHTPRKEIRGTAQPSHSKNRTSVSEETVFGNVRSLLDQVGSGTRIKSVNIDANGDGDVYCANIGARKCIVSEGEEHQNNNMFLVAENFNVFAKCFSSKCAGKRKFIGKLDSSKNDESELKKRKVLANMRKSITRVASINLGQKIALCEFAKPKCFEEKTPDQYNNKELAALLVKVISKQLRISQNKKQYTDTILYGMTGASYHHCRRTRTIQGACCWSDGRG